MEMGLGMLTGVVGGLGSGKTLFVTKCLYDEYRLNHKKIMANYNLRFPHEKINVRRLLDDNSQLHDIAVGIDEFHVFFDSRVSGSRRNRLTSYFVLQTRKRNVNLYFTTQNIGQVDKRMRQQMHRMIVCNRTGIDSDHDGLEDVFKINVIDMTVQPYKMKYYNFYGRKYFDLYDTNQIISPFDEEEESEKNDRRVLGKVDEGG